MKSLTGALFLLLFLSCLSNSSPTITMNKSAAAVRGYYPASHTFIKYYGRVQAGDSLQVLFAFPGVNIRFAFKGSSVSVKLKDLTHGGIQADGNPAQNFFNVYIDNRDPYVLALSKSDSIYELASDLPDEYHEVKLVKRTESAIGKVAFGGIQLNEGAILQELADPELKIEFIGNSITCGYGVEAVSENEPYSCRTENVSLSYAVIAAEMLNAEYNIVAFSGRGIAQNYDKSRENTMGVIWQQLFADEPEPLWDHSGFIPNIVVINLGTNDFYCGVIDTVLFRSAYMKLLEEIREAYKQNTRIICLLGPMLNDDYPKNSLKIARSILESVIEDLKNRGDNTIFLYELSVQTGKLGYGADWHPSVDQQKKNALELYDILKSHI